MSDWNRPMPGWPVESLKNRLMNCLIALSIHGVLTDAEVLKAKNKLVDLVKEAGADR